MTHEPGIGIAVSIMGLDQPCQYTSKAFGDRCAAAGVLPSMGEVGTCYDNAMAESFFATLECELLDRTTFKDPWAAKAAVFDFIEGFYNTKRIHSGLGYLSPVEFERVHRLSIKKLEYSQVTSLPPDPPQPSPQVVAA